MDAIRAKELLERVERLERMLDSLLSPRNYTNTYPYNQTYTVNWTASA